MYCVSAHRLSVKITDRHLECSHTCFRNLAHEMGVVSVVIEIYHEVVSRAPVISTVMTHCSVPVEGPLGQ
jgi:hypothetical protein